MKNYAALALGLCILSVQAGEFTKKKMSLKNKLVSIVAAEVTTLPVTVILATLSWSSYHSSKKDYAKYLNFKYLSESTQYAQAWVDCIDRAHGYRFDAQYEYVMCGLFSMLALASAVYVPYWLHKKGKEAFWTHDYNMLVDCLEEIQDNPLLLKKSAYQEKLSIPCKNLIAWKIKKGSFSEADRHDIVTLLEEIQKHISSDYLAGI